MLNDCYNYAAVINEGRTISRWTIDYGLVTAFTT
jgi:hypothetical protein